MRETVQKAIDERLNDLRNPKSLLSLNKMESDTNKGYNGKYNRKVIHHMR